MFRRPFRRDRCISFGRAWAGGWRFSPRELGLLFYYALIRLDRLAGFAAARDALVDVATSMYAGDIPRRDAHIAAIRAAYAAVGVV